MKKFSQREENLFVSVFPDTDYIDVIYVNCFKILAPSEGGEMI